MPTVALTDTNDNDYNIPTSEVRRHFGGVSHMWVERRLKDDPSFPRPFFIAGRRFWSLKEIKAWTQDLRQRPHQRRRVERAVA